MNKHYQPLLDYISTLTIIDTHEHLPMREEHRDTSCDVLGDYLRQYLSSDLVAAGLPYAELQAAMDPARPLMARWDTLEPYWEACRHTGYARALDKTAQLLYGLPGVNRNTLAELNDAFLAARKNGGVYQHVLKDVCKIETSLLDCYYDEFFVNQPDTAFITPVFNIGSLVRPRFTHTLHQMEQDSGICIASLADYCRAAQAVVQKYAAGGLLKCALAYSRSIDFGYPDQAEAERAFYDALRQAVPSPGDQYAAFTPGVAFQNYVMHSILQAANHAGMVLQFHTGLQEGNSNYISHSDPTLLTGLVMTYKNVTFDLFHISYPFAGKAAVMAKNFANVTLDMCWAHIMSPRASVSTLLEWLDLVPYNKISAFGGDYSFVDGVAGHQQMARENVAHALSIACCNGTMDEDAAKRVAKALFYDNPKRIFRL